MGNSEIQGCDFKEYLPKLVSSEGNNQLHLHMKFDSNSTDLLVQSCSKQKTKWNATMISAWKDISAMYIWGREKKSQTKHWFSVWIRILNKQSQQHLKNKWGLYLFWLNFNLWTSHCNSCWIYTNEGGVCAKAECEAQNCSKCESECVHMKAEIHILLCFTSFTGVTEFILG